MIRTILITFLSMVAVCSNAQLQETIAYPGLKYTMVMRKLNDSVSDENIPNTVFSFYKDVDDWKSIEIFRDSIYSSAGEVLFEDFNNDGVKDILIQHYSDVRSNWSYHLYLFDAKKNKLTKIKGFEAIKNPHYIPKYNLISNLVMSGTNWSGFYQIQNNRIKDFDIIVKDDDNYDTDYSNAIRKIIKRKDYRKRKPQTKL